MSCKNKTQFKNLKTLIKIHLIIVCKHLLKLIFIKLFQIIYYQSTFTNALLRTK